MDARQVRRPNHSGVIDQFCNDKFGLGVIPPCRQVATIRLTNRLEQQLSRDRYSPAEHEQFRVEHRTQRGTGLSEPITELIQRVNRAKIFSANELRDEFSGEPVVGLTRLSECEADATDIRDLVGHPQKRTA